MSEIRSVVYKSLRFYDKKNKQKKQQYYSTHEFCKPLHVLKKEVAKKWLNGTTEAVSDFIMPKN